MWRRRREINENILIFFTHRAPTIFFISRLFLTYTHSLWCIRQEADGEDSESLLGARSVIFVGKREPSERVRRRKFRIVCFSTSPPKKNIHKKNESLEKRLALLSDWNDGIYCLSFSSFVADSSKKYFRDAEFFTVLEICFRKEFLLRETKNKSLKRHFMPISFWGVAVFSRETYKHRKWRVGARVSDVTMICGEQLLSNFVIIFRIQNNHVCLFVE